MATDPTWIWLAIGAAALLLVVAFFARGARSGTARELARDVERYHIRALTAAERERYGRDWLGVERHFVERPTTAVVEADELVTAIMLIEGYPMGRDFEKHMAQLSKLYPRVIEHYRAGHRVIGGAPGSASTEDLRQAMLHYRALFADLLYDGGLQPVRDVRPERAKDARAA